MVAIIQVITVEIDHGCELGYYRYPFTYDVENWAMLTILHSVAKCCSMWYF